jgi:hypothetical protein
MVHIGNYLIFPSSFVMMNLDIRGDWVKRRKGMIIGLLYGLLISILICTVLELLVTAFYGGFIFAITNLDLEILTWAISISILPTIPFFSWYGYRLTKGEMTKKQVWLNAVFCKKKVQSIAVYKFVYIA